ncbi:aspartic and glutamic acid-rich protein [Vanessa atalanta]|uniref:aspartic and glutamic acid-rich protein n=1 Tax=Vanessa atalanta TaxID=42275 RepID=UPI001FCE0ECB|nr:aspartic and glutamic acid-rich protein [Vanessa atalanta]
MKLLIAITLFVAVSAFPLSNKPLRDGPPIIFRHWEPTPENVRELQNDQSRYELIKKILNALPQKPLEEIIDALNIIHHILDDNQYDDDDADIAINDGEDENQSDLAPDSEGEAVNLEPPPHRGDNENDNAQQSNNESENSNKIPNKHKHPAGNQSQPEDEENPEEVDENDSQGEEEIVETLEGIEFKVPNVVQQQPN